MTSLSEQSYETPEKDLPLKEDIRFLGRLLGDTVREQQGQAVFDIVETIRQKSIAWLRDGDADAREALEGVLDTLDASQAVDVIRAYSYFSHLANIAEDQHRIRRTRYHEKKGSEPRDGSLRKAFGRGLCGRHIG